MGGTEADIREAFVLEFPDGDLAAALHSVVSELQAMAQESRGTALLRCEVYLDEIYKRAMKVYDLKTACTAVSKLMEAIGHRDSMRGIGEKQTTPPQLRRMQLPSGRAGTVEEFAATVNIDTLANQ
jgi:hypothetical protein